MKKISFIFGLFGLLFFSNNAMARETIMDSISQSLFILNGFETTLQDVDRLDANSITSVRILKDASTIASYGPRAANGVVIVETKKNVAASDQPLFILDGFETTKQEVYGFDPNRIESVQILKNAEGISLYGPKATNGVVIVTTKKEANN